MHHDYGNDTPLFSRNVWFYTFVLSSFTQTHTLLSFQSCNMAESNTLHHRYTYRHYCDFVHIHICTKSQQDFAYVWQKLLPLYKSQKRYWLEIVFWFGMCTSYVMYWCLTHTYGKIIVSIENEYTRNLFTSAFIPFNLKCSTTLRIRFTYSLMLKFTQNLKNK